MQMMWKMLVSQYSHYSNLVFCEVSKKSRFKLLGIADRQVKPDKMFLCSSPILSEGLTFGQDISYHLKPNRMIFNEFDIV